MGKITVLLAEDHTIVRKGLFALLKEADDIEVVAEAADGREAVSKADDYHPDVIVMDISMPLLSGLEATRQIVENHPDISVVILTMHTNEEYILRTFHAGASGYLVKASAPSELVQAIRAAKDGQTYLSPSISKTIIDEYVLRAKAGEIESRYDRLTVREREVLQLVAEGFTIKETSEHLFLSEKTVRAHRTQLMKKLDVQSIASLTLYAIKQGLITIED
ncbi:MAG: response regulator transcription factor [Anaerolineae bacterium]|nr:MAG: response regulator transcription factor [Anaerolineae bacterium]